MSSGHQCLVIAGEKSAEEHAMTFLPALMERFEEMTFWGVGGSQMEALGVECLYKLEDFSSWGYSEVLSKIPFYLKCFKTIEAEVKKRECKFAILIDFQTFNMKMAAKLKEQGVRVLYYVAPQAWAWKAYRAKKLADRVDTLFTIIPFEKAWFEQRGVKKVISVTHPVTLKYQDYLRENQSKLLNKKFPGESSKIKLLLLPGSRKTEIKELLPLFIECVDKLKEQYSLETSLVWASSLNPQLLAPYRDKIDHLYRDDELSYALEQSDLSLAASGTVTLTAALFMVPTVVAYRTSLFNQLIYELFVSYRGDISLANIVHQDLVFPEFLQERAKPFNLVKALKQWIENKEAFLATKKKLAKTLDISQGDDQVTIQAMEEVLAKGIG